VSVFIGSPRCPVCGSEEVKGYKVHSRGEWWSRCVSGLDHGLMVLPDGTEQEWPDPLYFTDSGKVEGRDGRIYGILRQEKS